MPKPYQLSKCSVCDKEIEEGEIRSIYLGNIYCQPCYKMSIEMGRKVEEAFSKETKEFNEPEHYHKHEIDTITFLQKGFPPSVFMGFAIGHIVKYAQRADYKNGREDYVKMVDYAQRALDWYDKTKNLGE